MTKKSNVRIPVSKEVRHFFKAYRAQNKAAEGVVLFRELEESHELNKVDLLDAQIINLIAHKSLYRHASNKDEYYASKIADYTQKQPLLINRSLFDSGYFYISDRHVYLINKLIERMFWQQTTQHLLLKCFAATENEEGFVIRHEIDQLIQDLELFDVLEDPYETIKKRFYRLRNKE